MSRHRSRSPRSVRTLTGLAVAVALAGAIMGVRALLPETAQLTEQAAHAEPATTPAASPPPPTPATPGTMAFAQVGSLTLYLPSTHLVAVAYHEAALPEAARMSPLGSCIRNANRYKFTIPSSSPGPRYIVMSSRGRTHPATSAVDMAMAARQVALSPITGVVANIKGYHLYGRYLDFRLSLIPADHPGLRVIVIHVTNLRVHRGSTLVAGVTPIGSPRVFSFRSQVNDYVGPGIPHIHIEVNRIVPPAQ